jgi:hypothetical protein
VEECAACHSVYVRAACACMVAVQLVCVLFMSVPASVAHTMRAAPIGSIREPMAAEPLVQPLSTRLAVASADFGAVRRKASDEPGTMTTWPSLLTLELA